ncbi:MAG TPA: GH25 family lysozyme [Nocardioidaceae bacterium]|nr:GH25 family lysozyme [Nocardioidaceae bacterium]
MLTASHRPLQGLARTVVVLTATLATVLAGGASAAAGELGIDVSSHQHGTSLDWSKVGADDQDIKFAFVKATEGRTYTNPYFAGDWSGTKSVGLYRGAYHFARPSTGTAAAQARFFVNTVGAMNTRGILPPVLDLERTGNLGVAALRTWTATWLSTVRKLSGRTPIIYTSPSFWENHMGNSAAFTGYPLWVAHYGVNSPRVPGGWDTWTFWQGNSTGDVNGISGNVDMNAFNGSYAQLGALAGGALSEPDPVTPPPTTEEPRVTRPRTTTSLALSRKRVYTGRRVTVSGDVATRAGDPVARGTIRVRRLDRGATRWVTVATVRSDSAGHYAVRLPVNEPASFRAILRASTTHRRSVSPIGAVATRAKVDTSIGLDVSRTHVRRRHRVRVFGHLTTASGRPLNRRRVRVYQRPRGSGAWSLVATTRSVGPDGRYQVTVRPRRRTAYRAVFPGAARFEPATSRRRAVIVRW